MHGQNLETLRRKAGLGQVELASRAGVAQSTVSKIENGEIRNVGTLTLRKLARALDMTLGELLAALEAEQPAPTAA
jgi:transcriptional regulator with XRE-family HTH domain